MVVAAAVVVSVQAPSMRSPSCPPRAPFSASPTAQWKVSELCATISMLPTTVSAVCNSLTTVLHSGSLIHEGSAVLEGVKYVIRSDVMYDLQG